jgi:hypothetical protein
MVATLVRDTNRCDLPEALSQRCQAFEKSSPSREIEKSNSVQKTVAYQLLCESGGYR